MYFFNMNAKQFYRLSPVLWDSVPGQYTATVYSIDRMPEGHLSKFVTCTPRCRTDPAWWWAGSTFFRLRMPPGITSYSCGPQDIGDGVVFSQLPVYLSWLQQHGYNLPENFQFSKISPFDDITLIYMR
jgi:hypothetical protein